MGRKGKKSKANRAARRQGTCVYCGKAATCTDEHVVPRGLFDKDAPLPDNLIVVPACRPCNERKSRDDSFVRDLLVADEANTGNPLVQPVLKGQVARSMKKGWSDFSRIAQTSGRFLPVHSEGGIYLRHAFNVPIDWKRVNRFFQYVTKGLYWHFFGETFPADYQMDVRRLDLDLAVETIRDLQGRGVPGPYVIGDGVFGVIHALSKEEDDLHSGIWVFAFYNRVFMAVITGRKEFFDQFQSSSIRPVSFD